MKKIWTQAPYGSGELDAGSTPLMYVLARPGDESLYTNNTMVYHFDITCINPSAILELTIGRTNINATPGSATESAQPNNFRGSNPVVVDSAPYSSFVPWDTSSGQPGPTEVLGQYYVTAGVQISADFADPIECLRTPGSSQAQAFSYTITRVDGSDATAAYHLNVWFDEY